MTAGAAKQEPFAAIAEFGSASELYHAAEKVRDKGFRFWDVHSPFPIHGMNKAMGLGKSYLGYIIFCGGFCQLSTGRSFGLFSSPLFRSRILQLKAATSLSASPPFPFLFSLTAF